MVVLVAVYGAGTAFFRPAFDADRPGPAARRAELAQANSLDQFVRPVALRLAGPALGGWLIAAVGTGAAFAVDAATFAVSAVAAARDAARAAGRGRPTRRVGAARASREGLRFVRGARWLWGTLVSAAFAYLLFLGPTEVLLPFVVKNDLGGSAGDLGLVFAAGGVGRGAAARSSWASAASPRRDVTFMYAVWTLATLAVAGYGLATAPWQLMARASCSTRWRRPARSSGRRSSSGTCRRPLLGRVSSLDWLISIGLLPLSFALTGPVAGAIGAQATLSPPAVVGAVGDGRRAAPARHARPRPPPGSAAGGASGPPRRGPAGSLTEQRGQTPLFRSCDAIRSRARRRKRPAWACESSASSSSA